MKKPDRKIIDFIDEHHVLTLATTAGEQPYIAHCFFVFMEEENIFVFTSTRETRHGTEMTANNKVAAGIALETKTVGKIRGLQITGIIEMAEGEMLKKAKKAYLKAYPYALLHLETLWILKPEFFKLTDNRLGFGKKIVWKKDDKKQ
jgi:uncharacterized protein YhbP (UPF0306 family)